MKWEWIRLENQARGAWHTHCLVWLKDDPGIVDLVKTAMAGHVAGIELAEFENNTTNENEFQEDDEKMAEEEPESEEIKRLKKSEIKNGF